MQTLGQVLALSLCKLPGEVEFTLGESGEVCA